MRQGHPSALTFCTVLLLSLAASLLLTVPSKAIAQTYIPLHNFSEAAHYLNDDGVGPYAGVVLSDNALFGTTQAGGTNGAGTVYKMKTDGTGFVALHSFYPLTDGSYPYGGLIVSSNVL